jgi:uncharacterized protein YndB with AHSA1/START domain
MTEPGIALTRVFDAPRERVWAEWTEPERFAGWFGGPDAEVPLTSVTMDVRPGGAWRLTMFYGPDRREMHWLGEYHEVEPPERLVFTISDEPAQDARDTVIVVLTELGDGRTEMYFEQRGDQPPDVYEAARSGWGVFFDTIDAQLVTTE